MRTEPGRRGFIVGSMAGILGMAVWPVRAEPPEDFAPTPWFVLGADGMADMFIAKAEIGQHIGTAQAQAVAEELDVPWSCVRLAHVVGYDPKYGEQLTGGSTSIVSTFETLSRAGAAGRLALVSAAAASWKVPAGECRASQGTVRHDSSGRSISYGVIVRDCQPSAYFSEDALKSVALKPARECVLVGTSVPAADIPSKVDGSAQFGIDHSIDGQVFARPRLPPVRRGARVTSVDDSRARAAVPGYLGYVQIADPSQSLEGWVVAYASDWWSASKSADLLDVTYDLGSTASVGDAALQDRARKLQTETDAPQFVRIGDARQAVATAARRVEAAYLTGVNLHGQMEPLNASAELRDGLWHVYAGTQNVGQATQLLAKALEVPESQIRVHQFLVGGGFGRKLDNNYMVPAALAAKAIGKPVKLVFARADDLGFDNPRMPTYQVLHAALDADGKLAGLVTDVVAGWPSAWIQPQIMVKDKQDDQRGIDPFAVAGTNNWYDIPNQSVRAIENDLAGQACPPGYLRGVGPGYTIWALECLMDECAATAGQDPVAFRLAHLTGRGRNAGDTPVTAGGALRLAAVLRLAASRAGYGTKLPKDTAFGVAGCCGQSRKSPSWIGCIAQVAVDRSTGQISVQRLTLVVDIGQAVNPRATLAQIEGATLFGLSVALHERCSFQNGRIVQTNFNSFRPLRIDEAPALDVTLVKSDAGPSGIGEPALTVVGPAIGNAIYNACGVRLRSLPITPAAVLAGLQRA